MPTFRIATLPDFTLCFLMDDAAFETAKASGYRSVFRDGVYPDELHALALQNAWTEYDHFPWFEVFAGRSVDDSIICPDDATCEFLAAITKMYKENHPRLMDKDCVDTLYAAIIKRHGEGARRQLVQRARAQIRKRAAVLMADFTDRLVQEDRRCRAMRKVIDDANSRVSNATNDADIAELLELMETKHKEIAEQEHFDEPQPKRHRCVDV